MILSTILILLSAPLWAYMAVHDHGKLKGWGKTTGFFGRQQWTRKYKCRRGSQYGPEPAFPGSTTFLVMFIDAYHASQALARILIISSLVNALSLPYWWIPILWAAYATVFSLVYKWLQR